MSTISTCVVLLSLLLPPVIVLALRLDGESVGAQDRL